MKKLIKQSWEKGGRSPEGAYLWLKNNGPKFGLFSSLNNVDGESAAETLSRYLAGYEEEAITRYLIDFKISLFGDLIGVYSREREVPKDSFDSILDRKDKDRVYQSDLVRDHIRSSITRAFSSLEQQIIGRDEELITEIKELSLASKLQEYISDLKTFIPKDEDRLVAVYELIRVLKYIDDLEASELAKGWLKSEVEKAVGRHGRFDAYLLN